MSSKRKVLQNSMVYIFSNFLLRAFNFFLLPLYTAYLTTKDYGTTNLIKNFTAVMSIICVFSLYAAVARFYIIYKEDSEKVKRFFGTLITFTFFSGICFTLIVYLAKPLFMKYIFKGLTFMPTVIMAVIGVVFSSLYNMYQYILKGTERAKESAITSIVYFLMMLILNIIFVVKLKLGANGVILATLITNFLCAIYMIISLLKDNLIILGIDKTILKDTLKYSIPLMPHDLSTTITSLFSSIFINNSYSLASLGIYSLASQFGEITDTVQASVNTAFQPWFFTQMDKKREDYKKNINELTDFLLWAYSIIFLGLALFSQEVIILFLNSSYTPAWRLIPIIVITYCIKSIYYFYVNVLFFHRKAAKYIFISTLSSSIFNVILSAILIPKYDAVGSILADIISMIVRVAIIIYISNKFDNIGYRLNNFLKIISINIIFIFTGLFFSYTKYSNQINIKNLFYKIIVFGVFCMIILIVNKDMIKNIIKKSSKKKF